MLSVNMIFFKFFNFDWVFVKYDNILYFWIVILDKIYVNLE